jgi:ribosomal protein L16 Arg81 hydroxylase
LHLAMEQCEPMLATLKDLLAPIAISEFLKVFRARKRLYIAASNPTRAESLFSWRDIDSFLSAHMLDENVRLMRDGVRVGRLLYTSNEGKQFNLRAFHDLLRQGASIVVDDVEHWVPQIRQLSAAIEREMGIRTNVNAYLSFSRGGAFKPHWDIDDVLIVQIHGNKRWRVWNAEVPHPVEIAERGKVNTTVPPDQEFEMAPGDVLFIPRGEPHAAAVSTGRSVHLTIGLSSYNGIDFLVHLRKEAAKDPLLRMDLPRHSSDEQASAHEAELKRRLHALIDSASMSQFLREGDLFRPPASETAVSGALPQMNDFLRLTLRRRIPIPIVASDDAPQPLTIGGEVRRLSPASVDALRWLFDHDPATFRELYHELAPRYAQESIEASIHELLRFGFLAIVKW